MGAAGPSHWFLVRYPRSARPARLEPRRHSHSYHDGEADLGPRHLYRAAIHYRTSEPCECLAVVEARDGVAVKQAICPRACRLRGMHPAPVRVGARNQQRRAHDGEAKDLLGRCRESRVSGHAVSGQSVSRESAEGGNRVRRERTTAERNRAAVQARRHRRGGPTRAAAGLARRLACSWWPAPPRQSMASSLSPTV